MQKVPVNICWLQLSLIAVLVFIGVTVAAQKNTTKQQQQLPNIIYIYADDLGYGELGCYGQQKIKTPNIDRMAAEGIRFTRHYAGAPVCAPSRAMLMTGKHSGHSYIRGNYELGGFADEEEGGQMPLPEGILTLPKMLKQAGYTTALCGKWGLGMVGTSGEPSLQGFDYYYSVLDQKQAHNFYPTHLWENGKRDTLHNPVMKVHRPINPVKATVDSFNYYRGKDYAIDKITEKALKFIGHAGQKPFFLYLSFMLPHLSLQVPDKYISEYLGQFNEKPYYGQSGYAAQKYPLSAYAAMITCLDRQVGLVFEKLKELGIDRNTLVMFSSDNGPTFHSSVDTKFFKSTAGLRGLKMDLYEGGIRVPFIARWPEVIRGGKTSDLVCSQYDLLATIAELTGQSPGGATDGISFLSELKSSNNKQAKHEFLYFEYPENGGQVAIVMGNWKGVRTQVRKNKNAPWQLFNLAADPSESNDLASVQPSLVRQLNAIQAKEHQCAGIRDWEFIDPKFDSREFEKQ
jgi:arylsulfatase A-like enzyme